MATGFALWRTTMKDALLQISARQLRNRMAAGAVSAVDVTRACLTRIREREDIVQAWAWLDEKAALDAARARDAQRDAGEPLGPLFGVPVGVKDVIDTGGIPTENGCRSDAGRIPEQDASLVRKLRQAGAIVLGKTVTTELAFLHPSRTRNPHNPEHTPGGSSSGSAAAVADGMVPLAIGTQTGGSVNRPAAFCGVVGLKPTFDTISRSGVLAQSHSLDTVGVFARDPDSAALLLSALAARPSQPLKSFAADPVAPLGPDAVSFGFIKLPGWERADIEMRERVKQFCAMLGSRMVSIACPEEFHMAAHQRALVNAAEMAHHFGRYANDTHAADLGEETSDAIRQGREISAPDYLAALDYQSRLSGMVNAIFQQCDIIVCPPCLGAAPAGLASTGDSIFNGIWTMAGTPSINLPYGTAKNGLPLGVQLVARRGSDVRLLKAAHWIWLNYLH